MSAPRGQDLFDEGRLRRALRLDSGEIPAPIDVAAIVALAERGRSDRSAAALLSSVLAALAGAVMLAFLATASAVLAPALVADVLATAIAVVARIAVIADAGVGVIQDPTIPIAALAAIAVAVVHELRGARGVNGYRTA